MLDVFSRKIVGHEVLHVAGSADLAALLMRKASLAERLGGRALVLHSDNGSAMTVLRRRKEQQPKAMVRGHQALTVFNSTYRRWTTTDTRSKAAPEKA